MDVTGSRPFSTKDRDNDSDGSGNCAVTHQSGWWYDDCGGCNPTGRLQPISDTVQSSDPTYMYISMDGQWAPRIVEMFLEKYDP